ncbi:TetR-like C-terminal domain-containing protein [Microbacterium sediminicola]|uniref:TetR-like C-terminal domain-containing protein n=1 Tax=Microbacterium sediminicola TaxID=415210 RepID=A0ABN2I6L1_9MICO
MPRAGLSREAVVAAAADIADGAGWNAMSLTLVADSLGVRVPSLYKHVASLDDLRAEVAALATRELGDALRTATVGVSEQDALRSLCSAYRSYALAHQGRYEATQRPAMTPGTAHAEASADVLAIVTAVLAGYGIAEADRVDATRAVRAALHGFAALETGGGFGMPQSVDRSFDRLVWGLHAMLTAMAAHPAD